MAKNEYTPVEPGDVWGDHPKEEVDPVVMDMMYKRGVKPGEDNGSPEEKAAYAEYYAKRKGS